MKIRYFFLLAIVILPVTLRAQFARPPTNSDDFQISAESLTQFSRPAIMSHLPKSYSIGDTIAIGDSSKYNMYGDLRDDDLAMNPKSPWYIPAIKVIGANLFTFSVNRYLLNSDFSYIGFNSWKSNLKNVKR